MMSRRTTRLLLALGLLALGPGCAPLPGATGDPLVAGTRPGGAEADALAAFLADAAPGESAALSLPDEPAPVVVSIEREYQAASGRTCRHLLIHGSAATPEPRIACRDALGVWRLLPRLINRRLLSAGGGFAD